MSFDVSADAYLRFMGRWSEPLAGEFLESADVRVTGQVLDVGCGPGALTAVLVDRHGAPAVAAIDPSESFVAAIRERFPGLDVRQGTAEALPYDDDSFDAVISMYGVMFAPNQQQAADELVRVCRPGGRIGVAAWTPAGSVGQLFMLLAQHLPPPPEGFQPPILWGLEDHVRGLFAASGATVTCTPERVPFAGDSVEAWIGEEEQRLGPLILAREALEPEGRWEEVRAKLVEQTAAANQATDGSLLLEPEYLLSVIELPG